MYFLDKPNLTLNFDKVPFADDIRDLLEQYEIEYTETDFESADYYFDYYTNLQTQSNNQIESTGITIPTILTNDIAKVYQILGTSIHSIDDRKLYVNFLSRYTNKKTDVILTTSDIDELSLVLETLNKDSLPILLNFISRYDFSVLENRQLFYTLLNAIIQKSPGNFLGLINSPELIEKIGLTSKMEYYKVIVADTVEMGKDSKVEASIISLNDNYLLSFSDLLLDNSDKIKIALNNFDTGRFIQLILGADENSKGNSTSFNISKEEQNELERVIPYYHPKSSMGGVVKDSMDLIAGCYPNTDTTNVLHVIALANFNNSLTRNELIAKFNIQIV